MLFVTVIIVLVGLSTSDPLSRKEIAKPRADNTIYRLKTDVIPKEYTLKLTPDLDTKTFKGDVKILLEIKQNTKSITFHHRNLVIEKNSIKITDVNNSNANVDIKNSGPSESAAHEFYLITTKSDLIKDHQYVLHIPTFEGSLNGYRGFYYAEYRDENNTLRKFATTHFEPTGARQAFPCFDEPKFKAKFKIYITRPDTYNSVSNMKLVNKRSFYATRTVEDEFELSVLMPTYLVAFIVSEMKLTTITENNTIETLAPPADIAQGYANYSVDTGSKIMKSIENFVNISYSMEKMYQASIPDKYFTPGAMENWGLVTYKKSLLLITPETSTLMKQQIDTIIAHEFGHQWFGNLATQEWWRYLWLSEGFATYFQYKAVDDIKPEWKLMEQFVVRVTQLAFRPDSLNSTRSMNQDAGTPAEISALFDRIAYEKSGAVIRMLETILTLNVFKIGIKDYITKRQYSWAVPDMLYESLDSALSSSSENLPDGLTIQSIMKTWDSEEGYPLVTVTRRYDSKPHIVQLDQNRFIFNSSSNQTWTVPINYATRGDSNFTDLRASEWLSKETKKTTIHGLNAAEWLILNKQEAYYYRVNYDESNWRLIIAALMEDHSQIHVLNRAQIIDDSFNIAKFDLLNYSIPLSVSLYLEKEVEYVPFLSFFNALTFFNDKISGTTAESDFQEHMLRILQGVYEHLGFEIKDSDSHTDKLNRVLIIHYLSNFNHLECRSKALSTFREWKTGGKIPLDLESSILCSAMRTANQTDWNYLYDVYMTNRNKSEIPRFQSYALPAFGCSEDSSILENFLNLGMPTYSNGISFNQAVSIVTKSGTIGVNATFNYVEKYFSMLSSMYDDKIMSKAIEDIGSKLTTEEQLSHLQELAKKHKATKIFAAGIEKAKENVKWTENHLKEISTWLVSNKPVISGTPMPLNISLFAILYSIVIKIF